MDLGLAQMRVLASGDATNGGAFALTEFWGTGEGAWTVPHLHRGFEESFFILDGLFTFTVADNGLGIEPDRNPGGGNGFGVLGMSERAAALGGELTVQPAKRRGTQVSLRIPLPAEAPAAAK